MMEVFTFEQGTPEWFQCRMGIPTASMFHTVMAKGVKPGEASKTRRTYMLKLVGEIITNIPTESYINGYMNRGHEMEAELRDRYTFDSGFDVSQVGFIRNGYKGASPDALVGTDGMLEIKTEAPHLLAERLLTEPGKIPPEHMAQLQGNLWVAERNWIDIVIGYTGMPMFKTRANRDETYIKTLDAAVRQFNAELAELVAKIRGMA
jgi:hypothetical protein